MSKFTRSNIQAVFIAAGMDANHARKMTARIIEDLAAALAAGKIIIELRGLGTLELRTRKARVMRTPRTLDPVNVLTRRVIFFKPSGKLKRAINGEGKEASKAPDIVGSM